jgi:hypothetical protein
MPLLTAIVLDFANGSGRRNQASQASGCHGMRKTLMGV